MQALHVHETMELELICSYVYIARGDVHTSSSICVKGNAYLYTTYAEKNDQKLKEPVWHKFVKHDQEAWSN